MFHKLFCRNYCYIIVCEVCRGNHAVFVVHRRLYVKCHLYTCTQCRKFPFCPFIDAFSIFCKIKFRCSYHCVISVISGSYDFCPVGSGGNRIDCSQII